MYRPQTVNARRRKSVHVRWMMAAWLVAECRGCRWGSDKQKATRSATYDRHRSVLHLVLPSRPFSRAFPDPQSGDAGGGCSAPTPDRQLLKWYVAYQTASFPVISSDLQLQLLYSCTEIDHQCWIVNEWQFIFIFQDMCDFEITQRLAHSAQFYIL